MQYVRFKDYIKPGASSLILGAIITLVLWYDLYLPIGLSECQGENLCLGDSPLVDFFLNSAYIRSWRGILFSFIFLLAIAFLMIQLNERFSFINVRTVLPAYIFCIVYSIFYFPHGFSVSLLVVLFVLGAIYFSFKMVDMPYMEMSVYAFNTGLLLSLATIFSLPCLFYTIPILIFFYVCKAMSLRNILALFFGICLPILYLLIYLAYVNDLEAFLLFVSSSSTIGVFSSYASLQWWDWSYLIVYTTIFVLGLLNYSKWRGQLNVRNREEHFFILIYFLFTLLLLFVFAIDVELIFPLLFLFASFTVGQYFSMVFSLFSKIVGILFIVVSLLLFSQRIIFSIC